MKRVDSVPNCFGQDLQNVPTELQLHEVLYKIINDNIKILKLFKLAKFPNVAKDINNFFAEECSVICTENTDTLA